MKRQEPFDGPTRRTQLLDTAVAGAVFAMAFGQILLDPALSPQMACAIVGAGLSLSLLRRSTRPHLAVAGVAASLAFAAATGSR